VRADSAERKRRQRARAEKDRVRDVAHVTDTASKAAVAQCPGPGHRAPCLRSDPAARHGGSSGWRASPPLAAPAAPSRPAAGQNRRSNAPHFLNRRVAIAGELWHRQSVYASVPEFASSWQPSGGPARSLAMTILADQYRQRAENCRRQAAQARDPRARAAFQEAARDWELLAATSVLCNRPISLEDGGCTERDL